jgi:hypothetical protein
MAQWVVKGASAANGRDVSIRVEADSERSAREQAKEMAIYVERVELERGARSLPLKALIAAVLAVAVIFAIGAWAIFGKSTSAHESERAQTTAPPAQAENPTEAETPAEAASVAPVVAARPKATISGSAWITRQNGESDILRGLRVLVVPAAISADRRKDLAANLKSAIREASTSDLKDAYGVDMFESQRTMWNAVAEEIGKGADSDPKRFAAAVDLLAQDAGLNVLAPKISGYRARSNDVTTLLVEIVAKTLNDGAIASTNTNIDGKFEVSADWQPGCRLLAVLNTRVHVVMWSIEVPKASSQVIELRNDNASVIVNK